MQGILEPAKAKNKKYSIRIQGKKINFGDDRYEDFTQHKDPERKKRYILRHEKNEDWNDPSTAGFWSKNLCWNKPTIEESIKDIKKRFGIDIINML
jgi:hypothetical protein